MSWRPLRKDSGRKLIALLKNDEWRYTALCAQLKRYAIHFGGVPEGRMWILEQNREIRGCLYISYSGNVLPAFNPASITEQDNQGLRRILLPRSGNLFSCMGMREQVEHLEKLTGGHIRYAKNYLICIARSSSRKEHHSNLRIYQATPSDLEILWPLERGYQYEEVLEPGTRLNDAKARKRFLETLQHQKVFYATFQGMPIAKAGTNARGWNYDQIGGVFVVPEHRRRGAGQAVMGNLMQSIRAENREICLFVKENNQAALNLYAGLGFSALGKYRISYW